VTGVVELSINAQMEQAKSKPTFVSRRDSPSGDKPIDRHRSIPFDLKGHHIRKEMIEEERDQYQVGEHDKGPGHVVPNYLSLVAYESAS
jgi:hypothetical protein